MEFGVPLFGAYLFYSFLDDVTEVLNDGEERQDFCEHGEGVPDLNVVFGFQTDDQCLSDLVVPLVTHMTVVLKVHVVVTLFQKKRYRMLTYCYIYTYTTCLRIASYRNAP